MQVEKSSKTWYDQAVESIVTDPEALSKVSVEVTDFEAAADIIEQIKSSCEMLDTGEHMKCAGLAANQLGFTERIIVIKRSGKYKAFINPVLIGGTKRKTSIEGCYSQPGRTTQVTRYKRVVVKAHGMMKTTLSGIEAIAFQHELDHLNGKLI